MVYETSTTPWSKRLAAPRSPRPCRRLASAIVTETLEGSTPTRFAMPVATLPADVLSAMKASGESTMRRTCPWTATWIVSLAGASVVSVTVCVVLVVVAVVVVRSDAHVGNAPSNAPFAKHERLVDCPAKPSPQETAHDVPVAVPSQRCAKCV